MEKFVVVTANFSVNTVAQCHTGNVNWHYQCGTVPRCSSSSLANRVWHHQLQLGYNCCLFSVPI